MLTIDSCVQCGQTITGAYHWAWTDAYCARCVESCAGQCAACGEFVFTWGATGGRVGPDGRCWCRVCGTDIVDVDVASGASIQRVQSVLRAIGVEIGITGLTVDLVPVTRPDSHIGQAVLGVAHSRFDGRSWDHHIKVQRFLPEQLFGGALVHEIMHAWLARTDTGRVLTEEEEEGICELFAHLWMRRYRADEALERWVMMSGRRTDVYGSGYRWAVSRYGLGHAGTIQKRIRRDISAYLGAVGGNVMRGS